ncbi:DUF805 domain-containing protein [Shimia sp. CNT1-13L.2]|uniref:DUF805 domain-containing protein n=1 Tax=Shimia sp. CNT1-13L.2 TaxID=2959663 RepID=UPI0034E97644
MERTFKGLVAAGLLGSLAVFWYIALVETSRTVEAIGVSFLIVLALGCIGWLGTRTATALRTPKAQEEIARIQERASQSAAVLSESGSQAARETGQQLSPRLAYLFSFQGRVTRMEYLVSQLVAGCFLVGFLLLLLAAQGTVWSLMFFSGVVASVVHLLAFGVRRTRDTGVNQWWYLLILVPPVDLALLVFLLLVPSDEFSGSRVS